MDNRELIPGCATRAATERYAGTFGAQLGVGHYSDFLNLHLKLSSLGIGTFPGVANCEVDAAYAAIVERALLSGINVVDSAAHYRYGRSLAAVGAGLRAAIAAGVEREQVFLVSKGGFLTFPEGIPQDFEAWFARTIASGKLGEREQLAGYHLLSPTYLDWQLDQSRSALGVETLDVFLVDQPEVHIPALGKEALNLRLGAVFAVLEQAVKANRLRCYGISTFDGFRVETDHAMFESLTSLLGLAEKAAQQVHGNAKHAFKVIALPFNQAMLEGFTRFNQATGQGNIASTIQAAHQLGIFVLASHTLAKATLAAQCNDAVAQALPLLANHAQRAMQFNRSTPGVVVSLVGISTPAHLDDLLAVAQIAPMKKEAYLKLYQRAE